MKYFFQILACYFIFAVNYGSLLLQALLEHWWRPNGEDEVDGPNGENGSGHHGGNEFFQVAPHTPLIFR